MAKREAKVLAVIDLNGRISSSDARKEESIGIERALQRTHHVKDMVLATRLRERLIRLAPREILIADLTGSLESQDAYTLTNCRGYGRIRTFTEYKLYLRAEGSRLVKRPLLRGHPDTPTLRTQVFQVAGCNWRCWYCYVDNNRLSANPLYGKFLTADQLIEMYLEEPDPPLVVDLSGGEAGLVPEWCLWTMHALEARGLKGKVFVWLDENLGSRNLWDYMTKEEIRYMATFPCHSRMGCFKGYDPTSFEFNTGASRHSFSQQFEAFSDLVRAGFDMYGYAIFTSPPNGEVHRAVSDFVDRLQSIHPNLPLRTVPLRIHPFTATRARMLRPHEEAIQFQFEVVRAWEGELLRRFKKTDLSRPIHEISLT